MISNRSMKSGKERGLLKERVRFVASKVSFLYIFMPQ